MSYRASALAAGLAAALGLSCMTSTETFGSQAGQARVVTRAPPPVEEGVRVTPLDERRRQNLRIVDRPIVAPAAVISRELSEQPVYTHLIEVQVGHTTVYIDPEIDYTRRGQVGGLDQGHFIVRAQRAHQARRSATPARVIRNELADLAPPIELPRARFIIPRPQFHDRPAPVDRGDRVEHKAEPEASPTDAPAVQPRSPQRVMLVVPASPRHDRTTPAQIVRSD